MRVAVITGSTGLIGSEAAEFFGSAGYDVVGIDNDMRRVFFGDDASTAWNRSRLAAALGPRYRHHAIDIRDRTSVLELFRHFGDSIEVVIHAAAQPSHDWAAREPFTDFDINAVGTLNLLEATRLYTPEAPFVFTSTNKVYGDAPNELPLVELETRFDFADPDDWNGIDERCRIDATMHSLFGASKVAADVLVQEYGRYFGMPTVCLRGGCLTGPNHSAAELHGFLAYLARATRDGVPYRIFGYKGKQVRDNIHSYDVCTAMMAFVEEPRCAAVYNLGGGRANSISVLEAIARFEDLIGRRLEVEYVDEARLGDHICYISDLSRFRSDYPGWAITRTLDDIFEDFLPEERVEATAAARSGTGSTNGGGDRGAARPPALRR